jgi:hypothetical protein
LVVDISDLKYCVMVGIDMLTIEESSAAMKVPIDAIIKITHLRLPFSFGLVTCPPFLFA